MSCSKDEGEKSMTRCIVSPSLYALRGSIITATGRDDLDMVNRVLSFACFDWLDRMTARSIASFDVTGSAKYDERRTDGVMGVVGESRPDRDD